MATVDLARGGRTTVDQKDLKMLSQYKWHLVDNGKVGTWVNDRLVYIHWLVMGYHYWGFLVNIGHINGHKLDNRRENLFINPVFPANKGVPKSSRVGITWRKRSNKWAVSIYPNGKMIHVGVHQDEGEAIALQDKAIEEYGLDKEGYIREWERP